MNKKYLALEKARNQRWLNSLDAQERRQAQRNYSELLKSFEDDFTRAAVNEYYDRLADETRLFGSDDYDPYFGDNFEF